MDGCHSSFAIVHSYLNAKIVFFGFPALMFDHFFINHLHIGIYFVILLV